MEFMSSLGNITSLITPAVNFIKDKVDLHYIRLAIRPVLKLLVETSIYQRQLLSAVIDDNAVTIRNCFYNGNSLPFQKRVGWKIKIYSIRFTSIFFDLRRVP